MKTYSRKKGDSPSNVIIHVNELCRLCLAKEEEMVPIYDDESVPLPLRILACVNIEVGPATFGFSSLLFSRSPPASFDFHEATAIISRGRHVSKNRNLVYLCTPYGVLSHYLPSSPRASFDIAPHTPTDVTSRRYTYRPRAREKEKTGRDDVGDTICCAKQLPALPSYRRACCDRYAFYAHRLITEI